jgi:hypothetical protein
VTRSPSKETRRKATPKRIELKDLLRLRDLQTIEAALISSPLGFHSPFPPRQINSLYFDSYDFRALEDSLSGSSIRQKTRLRWYGKTEYSSNPTLEFKCKQGHLSWKILRKTTFCIDFNATTWDSAFLDDEEEITVDLSKTLLLSNLRPTSLVSYSRRYFESADGRLRVTLDEDLTFRDQTIYSGPNLLYFRHHPEKLVIEIKVAEKDSDLLQDLAKTLPFVPRRFSKYCESLLGHMPRWI